MYARSDEIMLVGRLSRLTGASGVVPFPNVDINGPVQPDLHALGTMSCAAPLGKTEASRVAAPNALRVGMKTGAAVRSGDNSDDNMALPPMS
jgi:hypothetical protein